MQPSHDLKLAHARAVVVDSGVQAVKTKRSSHNTAPPLRLRRGCRLIKKPAEFAACRRQIKCNHFRPGRVPGRKYFRLQVYWFAFSEQIMRAAMRSLSQKGKALGTVAPRGDAPGVLASVRGPLRNFLLGQQHAHGQEAYLDAGSLARRAG